MTPTREQYKEKLRAFNSTPKYQSELDFLLRLLSPIPNEKILDYGCGLGTAVYYINENSKAHCFGYDVVNYREKDDLYLFRSQYFFKFDKVFFNHSISHVPEIEEKLSYLREWLNPDAKVFVITPNKLWIEHINSKDYKPDPTVIKHFYPIELEQLFTNCGYKVKLLGQIGTSESGYNERLFLEATI